jgi:transposase
MKEPCLETLKAPAKKDLKDALDSECVEKIERLLAKVNKQLREIEKQLQQPSRTSGEGNVK